MDLKTRTGLLGLIGATLTVCGPARAAFIAYIADDAAVAGGNDVVVTDNGAGDNFPGSALTGQINAGAVSFAGFTIITNVSQSKPLIGSAGLPQLDITFSLVTSDSLTHTVFLYAADTGFTFAGGTVTMTLGGTQPPAGDGNSVVGRFWGGAVNANTADPRGAGPLLIATPVTTATPYTVTATGALAPAVNPYALAVGVQVTRGTPGTTTGEITITVPESTAAFTVAGLAMPLLTRRRRVKAA